MPEWTRAVEARLAALGGANLANLMLARAERRQREIAVRAALGPSGGASCSSC